MTPDIVTPDIAELERQHRELQLPTAGLDDTWRPDSLIVAEAEQRSLAVTVDIRRGAVTLKPATSRSWYRATRRASSSMLSTCAALIRGPARTRNSCSEPT